jgi:hypothetical protein
MERVIWIGLRGEQNGPVLIWDAACKKLDPNFQSKSVNPTEWLRVEQVEAALSGIGFKKAKSEILPMLFKVEDADSFLHFWFESKNPVAVKCMNQWKRDLEPVEQAVREALKDDWLPVSNEICS